MKHSHHCHCGLSDQLRKFKAGKLGLLGGLLIVGHLLFHVAECLIIPSIIIAVNNHDINAAEEQAETVMVNEQEVLSNALIVGLPKEFRQNLRDYYLL